MKMRKILTVSIIVIAMVAVAFTFVACSDKSADKTYTVSFSSGNIEGINTINYSYTGAVVTEGKTYNVNADTSFYFVVVIDEGFEIGTLKVEANGTEIKPSSVRAEEGSLTYVEYGVEVKSDVSIVLSGELSKKTLELTSEYSGLSDLANDKELVSATYSAEFIGKVTDKREGIATIEELAEFVGNKKVSYGDKLIIKTVVSGDTIIFPSPFDRTGNYAEEVKHTATINGKTYTRVDEIIFNEDTNLIFAEDTRISDGIPSQISGRVGDVGYSSFYNEEWEEIYYLNQIYNASEIYILLDETDEFGAKKIGNSVFVAAIRNDVIKTMTVNGKSVQIEKVMHNNRAYVKLSAPNVYKNDRADEYGLDFPNAEAELAASDLFIKGEVEFKSEIMQWSEDLKGFAGTSPYEVYEGYRYTQGMVTFELCLSEQTDSVTVIINGTKTLTFNDIQSGDVLAEEMAMMYRYSEDSEYFQQNGAGGIGDVMLTHELVISAYSFGGTIYSVEVK